MAITINQNSNISTPKKAKMRCAHSECKKKLSMVEREFVCVCEKCFCIKHRLPEFHSCRHDFIETAKNKEKKCEALKCVADKVIKI